MEIVDGRDEGIGQGARDVLDIVGAWEGQRVPRESVAYAAYTEGVSRIEASSAEVLALAPGASAYGPALVTPLSTVGPRPRRAHARVGRRAQPLPPRRPRPGRLVRLAGGRHARAGAGSPRARATRGVRGPRSHRTRPARPGHPAAVRHRDDAAGHDAHRRRAGCRRRARVPGGGRARRDDQGDPPDHLRAARAGRGAHLERPRTGAARDLPVRGTPGLRAGSAVRRSRRLDAHAGGGGPAHRGACARRSPTRPSTPTPSGSR